MWPLYERKMRFPECPWGGTLAVVDVEMHWLSHFCPVAASQCNHPGLSGMLKLTRRFDLLGTIFNPSSQQAMDHIRVGCLKDEISSTKPAGCQTLSKYRGTTL